jgi:hypothetical protein
MTSPDTNGIDQLPRLRKGGFIERNRLPLLQIWPASGIIFSSCCATPPHRKEKYRLIMIALAVGIAVGLIYGAVPFAAVVKLIGS